MSHPTWIARPPAKFRRMSKRRQKKVIGQQNARITALYQNAMIQPKPASRLFSFLELVDWHLGVMQKECGIL